MMSSLSPREVAISVVTYFPDLKVLGSTFDSLKVSLERAAQTGLAVRAKIYLIDNGSTEESHRSQREMLERCFAGSLFSTEVLAGHGNVGYGAGHNLAIRKADCEYHLVLNPDVELDPEAIGEAIRYMEIHPQVALISPASKNRRGQKEYLCKAYPKVFDLALRGFAPSWVRRLFSGRLARYELRGITEESATTSIAIASGCFMFFRADVLKRVGGFDDRYFMYFEDFDLSLRVGEVSSLAYVPAVRIVHLGGEAARKGSKHIRMFVDSAFKFYRKHGWRLV